jgi:hypothetical protein
MPTNSPGSEQLYDPADRPALEFAKGESLTAGDEDVCDRCAERGLRVRLMPGDPGRFFVAPEPTSPDPPRQTNSIAEVVGVVCGEGESVEVSPGVYRREIPAKRERWSKRDYGRNEWQPISRAEAMAVLGNAVHVPPTQMSGVTVPRPRERRETRRSARRSGTTSTRGDPDLGDEPPGHRPPPRKGVEAW